MTTSLDEAEISQLPSFLVAFWHATGNELAAMSMSTFLEMRGTAHHADIVSIEQDLREFGLSAGIVAVGCISIAASGVAQWLRQRTIRSHLPGPYLLRELAWQSFEMVRSMHVLTKSSNPRRVPLNSVSQSDTAKRWVGEGGLLAFVAFHDDPDARAHAPIDQLQW